MKFSIEINPGHFMGIVECEYHSKIQFDMKDAREVLAWYLIEEHYSVDGLD